MKSLRKVIFGQPIRFVSQTVKSKCPILAQHQSRPEPISLDANHEVTDTIQRSKTARPFSEMPTPRNPDIFGTNLSMILERKGVHLFSVKQHEKLGQIFRVKLSGFDVVFMNNPDDFKAIRLYEGTTPLSIKQLSLMHFYQIHPEITEKGLLFLEGEKWLHARRALNQFFMKGDVISPPVFQGLEEYTNNQLVNWGKLAQKGEFSENHIHQYHINAIAAVLMGKSWSRTMTRSGIDTGQIAHLIDDVFQLNNKMLEAITPQRAERFGLPRWKNFNKTVLEINHLVSQWTNEYFDELRSTPDPTVEEFGIFGRIYGEGNLSEESIRAILNDMLFLASHTALSANIWTLYALGRNPEVQIQIRNEIQGLCGPNGRVFGFEDVNSAPNVQNAVRESLRLFPIAPFTTRILSKEAILGGYKIPPGTLICLSLFASHRNPDFFPEADQYWPDRWLRHETSGSLQGVHVPLAHQPFGVGIRACVAKRITNTMMYLFFGKILQKYRIESDEVEPVMKTTLAPDKPINLRIHPWGDYTN